MYDVVGNAIQKYTKHRRYENKHDSPRNSIRPAIEEVRCPKIDVAGSLDVTPFSKNDARLARIDEVEHIFFMFQSEDPTPHCLRNDYK